MFHGLTAQQGDQIASYIRSLNMPSPGWPWNPPYQPGPGLDSQPVSNWAAGAGINAVLDSDAAMQSYLGSPNGWAANQYLNPRASHRFAVAGLEHLASSDPSAGYGWRRFRRQSVQHTLFVIAQRPPTQQRFRLCGRAHSFRSVERGFQLRFLQSTGK